MKTIINQPNKFGWVKIIFAKQGINVHIVEFFKDGFFCLQDVTFFEKLVSILEFFLQYKRKKSLYDETHYKYSIGTIKNKDRGCLKKLCS